MRRTRACFCLFGILIGGLATSCGDNLPNSPGGPDAAPRPGCSDNKDNDFDGKIDFPDDPGCEGENDESEDSPAAPACSDNRDNDGDGKKDYPDDPGCPIPQLDSEADDCPSGPGCPECGDGVDNDGNGKRDFPGDPGCAAAGDSLEFLDNPVACGSTMMVKLLPGTGLDTGVLDGTSTSTLTTPCGGGGGAPGIAYVFHVSEPRVMIASTDLPLTAIDTVLDLRSSMCSDPLAHLACHDDLTTTNKKSTLTRALQPGTYYLIVEGNSTADTGSYALQVNFYPGQGTACNVDGDCGPGLVCRIPVGATTKVCSLPVCNDTLDDDGDGKIDYPNDPGCASPTDATEDDVCATTPTDPACPACANGLDDDGDGQTDYPNDTSCAAASTISEACVQSEPMIIATTPLTTGTTAGAVNDHQPVPGSYNGHLCSTTATHSAPDRGVQLDLPAMSSLSLRLSPVGFDSSHSLYDASCSGTPIDCFDNPNNMVVSNLAAGRYYLIIDGYSTASGTFTLVTSGTIANGESCESALAQSGAITCGTGHSCKGAVGSRTCQPAECNDGIDNNGAGGIDYPADPGCVNPSDDTETTVCPGQSCPACADGIDNDGDLLIDYPADTGCLAASANNEGCAETDPIFAIAAPTTLGTLVGATDDHNPSCVATNLPDKIFTLDIPTTLQTLVIDTENSVVDTVLSFMSGTCSEPSIACDDDGGVGTGDSLISRSFVPAGSYTIAVDSDSTTLGTFELHVTGTIMPGGSCEGALVQAGVLICPAGFGCNGTPGARKCTAAQCQDGVDNNGDGTIDFPNDPSCTSASDNSEVTVCPGAACPVCADGVDNDGDGDIDYPDDSGCDAASDGAEGCVDSDPIVAIAAPTTTGTLVGAANDQSPICTLATINGADRIFTLDVPALQSLTIDTEGSTVDTVLSFMDDACQAPVIACDDDGGVGTGDSLITRGFVPEGRYTIALDADTATPNTFSLHVSGVIVPGASCESPLVAAGVLTCSVGFACSGLPGLQTCTVAECLDGLDNNADGRTDFPDDPGCDSFSDNTETTVCPGPACPVCSDGIDNDNDGATDYPADSSCLTASTTNEACNQSESMIVATTPQVTGTTLGAVNDFQPVPGSVNGHLCSTTATHSAPDVAIELDLPATTNLKLTLSNSPSLFDSSHSLLDATCGGPPIDCWDSPTLNTVVNSLAAGRYYVVVDGYSTASGPFTLNISGTIVDGESCESPLAQSGALTCGTGFACAGPVGARTCTPAQCNDGIDNNMDGTIDYPNDPGCASPSDADEDTVCPGPSCPVCSNTTDDDGDALTDFPGDFGCAAAGGTTEVFCAIETTPSTLITMPQTAGSLAAPATDNYEQTCQTSTGNDLAYGLQLPVPVATLVLDTLGSTIVDTVLSLWDANCAVQLACDDDSAPSTDNRSLITMTNMKAGNYAIQVDGFSTSNNGAFLLNVKGTVAAGTACTDALFTSGVLECPMGTTCTAGTCQ